eukprot:2929300-Ditylum_brightwellii.AAC.1
MSDMPPSNWRPIVDLINQVGILLERQKSWILHCFSRETHWVDVALASANKMTKNIILNPTKSYAMDKLENLVQIDRAQTSIRAMHQVALIGKALNQVIRQVDML